MDSLSKGRDYIATPGPSIFPDRVIGAMQKPAPNIYGEEIELKSSEIQKNLCEFAQCSGHVAIYTSNGHGLWEASLTNLFNYNDKLLVITNGRFGKTWGKIADQMGFQTSKIDFGLNHDAQPQKIIEILAQDIQNEIKGVIIVHVDTSTSIKNNIKEIIETIKRLGHPAMILVDCIASFLCDKVLMDDWKIDVMLATSQKGLMTPPGLGYIFVNKRAREQSRKIQKRSPYWDWEPRIVANEFYERFFGTPPTHLVYAQHEALKIIKEEGCDSIYSRHQTLAKMVWSAVEHWGKGGNIQLNVANQSIRSNAVSTIVAKNTDLSNLRYWLEKKAGLTLGLGIGFDSEKQYLFGKSVFRIGHMGYLNPQMILGVIATIETGLKVCNIPHAPGSVSKAADTLKNSEP